MADPSAERVKARMAQLAAERARVESLTPEERHKERLFWGGFEYRGVHRGQNSGHRAAHCYECKKDLSSSADLSCGACGWLICECGACKCGYLGF